MGILVSSFPIRARLDFPHTRVFSHLGEIRATGVFAYGHSVSRFSTSRVSTTSRTRFRGDNELERDFPRPKGKNLYHTGSSTNRDSSVSRGTLGTRVPQPTRRTEPARRECCRGRATNCVDRVTLDGCPTDFPRRRRHFAPPESLVRAPRAARRVMADVEPDLDARWRAATRAETPYARVVFDTDRARAVREHDNWRALAEQATTEDGAADARFRAAFRRYFATDYVFVEDFINLLARALSSAPTFAIKARLGAFLNALLEGEATLFRASLRELWSVDADDAASVRALGDDDVATAMSTFLRRVAERGDWLSRIAVVAVAEGLYLSWALRVVDDDVRDVASGRVDGASAERALYAKWVWPLHSSEEFQRATCAFVEAFNDAWRDADDDSRARCEVVAREMLDLERAFTELLSPS